VRDSGAYWQGKKDSSKIDVRQRPVEWRMEIARSEKKKSFSLTHDTEKTSIKTSYDDFFRC